MLEARAQLGVAVGSIYPQQQTATGAATYFGRSENSPNSAAGDLNYWQYDLGGNAGWEHAIWGKHSLFEESLRSPLIIVTPELPQGGTSSKAIVETVDLYPTLCDLTALPKPEGIDGNSLVPFLAKPDTPGHPAISYTGGKETIRTDRYRYTEWRSVPEEKVIARELYDHVKDPAEMQNLAAEDSSNVALDRLGDQLSAHLARKAAVGKGSAR